MEEREPAIAGGFGIRTPPLLEYLQGILRAYSDGQILKELLQNAEDAGASEIRFLYDENHYGTESLLKECLADFQGPALCSYNDAVFEDRDWKGIQEPAQSCKKNDVLKVGRFGIGFNSVYHLTDLPCIISKSGLAMIDPFEKYFCFEGRPSSGQKWNLGSIFENRKDQLTPFEEAFPGDVEFERRGYFPGTFFRFPLRKKPNKLSQSVFSLEKIRDLFDAFTEDARIVLLFLRNIERANTYWKEEFSQTSECFLEVSFASSCVEKLRQDRQTFSAALQNVKDNPNGSDNIELTNTFDIVTKCTDLETKQASESVQKWVVSQEIAINCSLELTTLYRKLKFLPWMGVAIPLFNLKETLKGRTFCFLPLPSGEDSLSGLPVHVHGFFGVSDDRRSLKWPGGDQIQNETAEWNRLLVNEILPRVYRKALLKAIDVTLEHNDIDPIIVYKAMPNINEELNHWKEAVETLFCSLFQEKVLYCHAQKAWMGLKEVIIMTSDVLVTSERAKVIVKCLQKGGLSVIEHLPGHVRDAIRKFAPGSSYTSARLVIECLQKQPINEYSEDNRLHLLDYLLSEGSSPEDMDGLQLLPTDAGGFVSFMKNPSANEIIYMGTSSCPQKLLPAFNHRFLKNLRKEFFPNLCEKLEKMCSSDEWKQFRWLDTAAVTQMLPKALPPHWSLENGVPMVWFPSANDQPDISWLRLLWQFACREDVNLTDLEGLKLLPVSCIKEESIQMMPLRLHSKVIKVENSDKVISNFAEIRITLKNLGVTVCEFPDFVSKHHQLLRSDFVYRFSPNGMLETLKITGAKCIETVCTMNASTQESVCSHLLPYLSGATFSLVDKSFLRGLSVFRPFQNKTTEALCSLTSGMLVLQEEDFRKLPNIRLHKKYLLVSDSKLLFLLNKLDVEPQPFEVVLKDILQDARFEKYSESEIGVIFEWVKSFYDMIIVIPDIKAILEEIPFVPNSNSKMRKPKDLYDASDEVIKALVFDKDMLPSQSFLLNWLDILLNLGMKTQKDITPNHLLEAAVNISSTNKMQAPILVEYLCRYPDYLIKNPRLCSQLKQIPFIPCVDNAPAFYSRMLPFAGKHGLLYKPSDLLVYSKETCALAGASAPLVAAFTSKDVYGCLGVRENPTLSEVLQQLHQCVKLKATDLHWEILKPIYEFLNQSLSVCKEDILQGLPEKWIFIGDQFMDVNSVYKQESQGAIDLKPFLCVLPREYVEFDDLLRATGVPDQVDKDVTFLLNVLQRVKENIKMYEEVACLTVVMNILRKLLDFEEKIEDEETRNRLYIPTSCNPMKLLQPDQVCYDDDTDYDKNDEDDFYMDEHEPIYLVHHEVSRHMAKRFGVPSLSRRLAGTDEIGGIKQTGQHEPITVRLKNIIRDGYQPESIPKEMVQNAEDAGASEVKFLLDLRSNSGAMKKLLDPAMREVQGPALWVFNDAVFTKEDLENITKLGGATKREDRSKIGQFGLGFNAVYHITDVPSFVTNNFFTIFDPHKSHLRSHFRGEGSGIQLNFTANPARMRRFQDQFMPYEGIFGCKMQGNGNGPEIYQHTLFRLPLRSETEARKSDICGESCNEGKMKSLLRLLCQTASQMLLFTENVKSISVYLLNKDEVKQTSLLYKVTKCTLRENQMAYSFRQAVHTSVTEINVDGLPANTTSEIIFDCLWTKTGMKYFQLAKQKQKCKERWIVTTSAGKGQAFNVCLEDMGKKSGLLPCGGVAWSPNTKQSGGVFCFLPLSVPPSGLPVCINGSFAVSADRRNLWRESETESMNPTSSFKTRWNRSLFEDVIVSAYITLLQQTPVKNHENRHEESFFLWPNPLETSQSNDYWSITTGFYKAIICGTDGKTPPKIFLKKGAMYSIDEVMFTVIDIQRNNKMFPVVERVVKQMTSKQVMEIPTWVRTGFEKVGHSSTMIDKTYSWGKFFKDVFLPNLKSVQEEDILNLVLHALSERDETVLDLMRHSECIPTKTSDGRVYKIPSVLLDPNRFKDIFFEDEGVFPEDRFLNDLDIYQTGTLKEIGCLKDDLTWEDVLERTRTVACVWRTNPIGARRRVKALLDLVDHKLQVSEHGYLNVENDLREVAFLPAKRDQDVHLQCPNKVYLERETDLVGYVCYVLDTTNTDSALRPSLPVKRLLGMEEKEVNSNDVIKNMRHLKQILQSGTVPDNLESQCNSMYTFLQTHVEEVNVQHFLQNEEWLLVDQGFTKAGKVSFCGESFPPYLYKVPNHYGKRFETLLRTAGVQDHFNYNDFIDTLAMIEQSQQGEPLEAQIVSNIITKVVKPLFDIADEIPAELISQILLPDCKNFMLASGSLSFCDIESFHHLTGEYKLCHTEIPLPWAKTLGVRDIRQQMLKKYSHSLPGFESIGERFGQREELVTRITRIMEGYPCDFTILKELVQNADDATATQVHFVLDVRKQPTQNLFYNSMKELQGPALLAFNNRPFTDDDIKGIQRLGVGNKGDDTDKTGRYGVGFNVVYHLTDCPMFLSGGDTLCIFDPTLEYVPDADEVNPGRMFRPIDEKMLTTYSDIFNCFFSFQGNFQLQEGTLFRFPLRQKKSKISDKVPVSKIETLFEDFKEEMFEVLLFLKNVTEISISKCTNGKLDDTYTVKAGLSYEDTEARKTFFQKMSAVKNDYLVDIPVSDLQYQQRITDNEGHHQEWLVHQRLGIEIKDRIPKSVLQVANSVMKLLPKGGVAARCFTLEDKASKDKRQFHGKAYCFLPLPVKTNLPVHVDGYFALGHEARRNLWEEPPGDPKSDWNRLIAKEIIGPAYVQVIEKMKTFFDRFDRGVDADNVREKLKDYHTLFPLNFASHVVDTRDFWEEISQAFYQRVMLQKQTFFPVIHPRYQRKDSGETSAKPCEVSLRWKSCICHSDEEGYFDNLHQQMKEIEESQNEPQHVQLRQLLLELGFPLLESPLKLYEIMKSILNTLEDEGVTLLKVNPNVVECFLKTNAVETILGKSPTKLNKTLISTIEKLKLLIKYVTTSNNIVLHGLPLLLTHDEVLRKFNKERKVYHSSYCRLLPKCSEHFLHYQFSNLFDKNEECFAEFDVPALVQKLPTHLPADVYCRGTYVLWSPTPEEKFLTPTEEWIKMLWRFLSERCKRNESIVVQYFGNWSILPVNVENKKYLVPMKLAKTVLSPCSPRYHEKLHHIIKRLHAPVLDTLERIDQFIIKFVSSLDNVQDIIHVFKRIVTTDVHVFRILQSEDHECILKYFSMWSHRSERGNLTVLKTLPCYETIHGEFIAIAHKMMYSVSVTDVPKSNQDTWISRSGCEFIKTKWQLSDLYKALEVEDISDRELYRRFILPCYKQFTTEAQWEHLSRIIEMVNSDCNPEGVVKLLNLKYIPLIPLEGGALDLASSFHDYENPVFKVMSEKKYFPPKQPGQTNQISWHKFLRLIGMQTEVSSDQFLQFAKQVSEEPNVSRREKILVEYLLQSKHLYNDGYFLSRLRNIAFISAAKVNGKLSELHEQCSIQKVTFSAVPEKHRNLVWSEAPLLPSWVTSGLRSGSRNYLASNLERREEPTLGLVVKHTQTLCSYLVSLEENTEHPAKRHEKLLGEIVRDIFEFLSKRCEKAKSCDPCSNRINCCSTCEEIVKALEEIPVVPLEGGQLFKAKRLTKHMPPEESKALSLFLKEVPDHFMFYSKLLYCLGATKEPSLYQYADILKLVEKQNLENNPNFIPAAQQAIQGFFRCLLHQEHINLDNIDKLFLLTDKGDKVLLESTKLYFNDKPSYNFRLQCFPHPMMRRIKMNGLLTHLKMEKLIARLRHLRPQLLSENVEEVPVNSTSYKQAKSDCECSVAQQLRQVLSWPVFAHALRIILAEEDVTDLNENHDDIFETTFTVKCLPEILTELRMKDGTRIHESQKDEGVLFNRTEPRKVDVFLSHTANTDLLDSRIAEKFNNFFGNFLKSTDNLQIVLKSSSEEDVVRNLSEKGLKLSDYELNYVDKIPTLGSILEDDIICLLVQDPCCQFFIDEYVAYNDTHGADGHYVYAKIVDRVCSETESAPTTSFCTVNYVIEVGGKQQTKVAATWLFKFPPPKDDPYAPEILANFDPTTTTLPRSTDIQVYGSMVRHGRHERNFDDLDKIKKEITAIIQALQQENISTRTMVLKRLMRKWHPDKHREELKYFAEEVFKHIQREIAKLEKYVPCPVDTRDDISKWVRQNTSQQRHYWNCHRRRFGTARQEGNKWYGSWHQSSYGHFYTPPSFKKVNLEACRWLKQACIDKDVAGSVVGKQDLSYFQWKISLCFFAVEKSIRAAQLVCGCGISNNQSIVDAATKLRRHLDVSPFVQELVQIVKKNSHYPSSCSQPDIPHDVFTKEQAEEAMKIACNIIEMVERYINDV